MTITKKDITEVMGYLQNNVEVSLLNAYKGIIELMSEDELNIDFFRPYVFISRNVWNAFFCDDELQFDRESAQHFMECLLFTVNFHREYLRGTSEAEDSNLTEETRKELSVLRALEKDEPLNFGVADYPLEDGTIPVYRIGTFINGEVETRLFEPERYPEEALAERAHNIENKLKESEGL